MKILNNLYLILIFIVSMPFGCLLGMCERPVSPVEQPLFEVTYLYDKDLGRLCKTATYNGNAGILTNETLCQEARKEYLEDAEVLVIEGAQYLQGITDPWQVTDPMSARTFFKEFLRESFSWRTTLEKIQIKGCESLKTLDVSQFFNLRVLLMNGCESFSSLGRLPDGLRKLVLLVACGCMFNFPNMRHLHGLALFAIGMNEAFTTTANIRSLIDKLPRELKTLIVTKFANKKDIVARERDFTVFPSTSELVGLKTLKIELCPITTIESHPAGLENLELIDCPYLENISNIDALSFVSCIHCPLVDSSCFSSTVGPRFVIRTHAPGASTSASAEAPDAKRRRKDG